MATFTCLNYLFILTKCYCHVLIWNYPFGIDIMNDSTMHCVFSISLHNCNVHQFLILFSSLIR